MHNSWIMIPTSTVSYGRQHPPALDLHFRMCLCIVLRLKLRTIPISPQNLLCPYSSDHGLFPWSQATTDTKPNHILGVLRNILLYIAPVAAQNTELCFSLLSLNHREYK